jgi:sarcosine oxidase subunit alpha
LRAGAHLIPKDAEATAKHDQGYVTSIAFSPSLGHWLGLGLLARGPERHGEIVRAYDPVRGGDVLVEVRPPCSSMRKGSASVSDRHLVHYRHSPASRSRPLR